MVLFLDKTFHLTGAHRPKIPCLYLARVVVERRLYEIGHYGYHFGILKNLPINLVCFFTFGAGFV